MSKLLKRLSTLSVGGLAFVAASAGAEVVLKYSNWFPAGHVINTEVVGPWIADVERVTEGRVKVVTLPKVVGTVPSQYDVVRDGLADIVLMVPGYTPDRFPLTEVMELPFLGDRASVRAPVTHRFYKDHLEKYGEYRNVHVIALMTGSAAYVYNTEVKVIQIDDFKGLKLRSPSGTSSKVIAMLGGIPVAKPASEIYELASGGIIDGALLPPDAVAGFNLGDALPNTTLIPGGIAATVTALVINRDKWNSLSQADREVIERVSGEVVARRSGSAHDRESQKALETYREAGHWIGHGSPELVAEMKRRIKPLEDAWFDKARRKGVQDPEKLLEILRKAIGTSPE